MRKIKKINGYLIVKFNDREKRIYEGTDLGEYGVIEAELYTGRLNIDRIAMKCDTAGTLEEAVELARSLEAEVDLTEEPATYTILVENSNKVSEKEVEPRRMVETEQSKLEGQAKSRFCPEVDERGAAHQLYGYKSALCDLGLLHEDERFVSPATFGGCGLPGSLPNDPEELLSNICDTVCGQRLRGQTQEELDAVCAKCAVQKLAQAAVFDTAVHPQPQEKTNFKNLDPKLRNDPLIPKLYQLGLMLEDDCPDNDCMIYRSTFRLAQELDTAMDSLSGYPAFVLRRDLRDQIRYLMKMYHENHAVREYHRRRKGIDRALDMAACFIYPQELAALEPSTSSLESKGLLEKGTLESQVLPDWEPCFVSTCGVTIGGKRYISRALMTHIGERILVRLTPTLVNAKARDGTVIGELTPFLE